MDKQEAMHQMGHQPVKPDERIHFLDYLRGFAMLGIMIVNYFLIYDSVNAEKTTDKDIWHFIVAWFAEGKFYPLFSFLFGVGFMIFIERAQQRAARPLQLFARRMAILLMLGFAHLSFVWEGDILMIYSLVGFLLLAFHKRKPKTLLVWAVILLSLIILLPIAVVILTLLYPNAEASGEEEGGMMRYDASLTYLQSIGERWSYAGDNWFSVPIMMIPVLAMFLLGMYFYQMGFFKEMHSKIRVWGRIWRFSMIGFVFTQAIMIIGTLAGTTDEGSIYELFVFLGLMLGGVTGCMFYMSSLALLFLKKPQFRQRTQIIGNIGRMSLTCYLLHSIIGTFLLVGYGFGLAEHLHSAGVWMICIGVYIAMLLYSSWWHQKGFRYGPMEWLWRRFTYGALNKKVK